jgi:raffinose/stachyose/melibiose transport system permease protein
MVPALALYLIFSVIPSLGTTFFSLTDITQVPGKAWRFVGLDNYSEFLLLGNARDTRDVFVRSLVYAAATTILQTCLALAAAIVLDNRRLRGRGLARTLVFLPVVLGVTVTGLCFNLLFSIDGPANVVLRSLGIKGGLLSDFARALPSVIFIQIWMSMGYEMVIFIAGLQNISRELYEAADVDGARARTVFWRITLPMLWPTVIVNLLVCVVGALSSFQIILITTRGQFNTQTLAMAVFSEAFGVSQQLERLGRQGYAAAMQMILFALILAVTLLSNAFTRRFDRSEL